MAMAAFKSTTKRSQVGPEGNGSSASSRGRRASSSGEPNNSKYFSDSSSMSGPRLGDARRPRASSRRHSSVESESDADASSRHYQRYSRRGSRDGSESDGAALRSLRRSPSQSDFSSQKIRRGSPFSDKEDVSGDELQVEERTIRAVHAQMKQLRNKNPSEEFDVIGLYDAMKVEVRQAIADLKQEIRQQAASERRESNELDDIEMRREYAEKLEQSERRASELWSELAQEEQRCMSLAKLVKDLLPDSNTTVSKRAYRTRRYANQRQMVSQSLDEDARKYFEECVSVSRLEFPGDEEDMSERSSILSTDCTEPEAAKVAPVEESTEQVEHKTGRTEAEQEAKQVLPETMVEQKRQLSSVRSRKGNDKVNRSKTQEPTPSKSQLSSSSSSESVDIRNNGRRRIPVNADGIAMPWLEWETGSESSQRSAVRAKNKQASRASSVLSSASDAETSEFSRERTTTSTVLTSEEEELLPHRIRFCDRILSGRMHVCTGLF